MPVPRGKKATCFPPVVPISSRSSHHPLRLVRPPFQRDEVVVTVSQFPFPCIQLCGRTSSAQPRMSGDNTQRRGFRRVSAVHVLLPTLLFYCARLHRQDPRTRGLTSTARCDLVRKRLKGVAAELAGTDSALRRSTPPGPLRAAPGPRPRFITYRPVSFARS